jgi:hypothetical protein
MGPAIVQFVSTRCDSTWLRAAWIASRTFSNFCGMIRVIRSSRQTTSFFNPSASGPGDFVAQRRHQVNPIRTQAGGEDRHRDDPAARKSEFLSHDAHDVAVAKCLTPADVKNTADGFRCRQDANQVIEHILDGDGLAAGCDPLWRDHHWQTLNQIAKNLERRRTRANDHRCAQDCNRHSGRTERRLHIPARREMFAETETRLSKPAQINDAAHSRVERGFANVKARSRSRRAYSRSADIIECTR